MDPKDFSTACALVFWTDSAWKHIACIETLISKSFAHESHCLKRRQVDVIRTSDLDLCVILVPLIFLHQQAIWIRFKRWQVDMIRTSNLDLCVILVLLIILCILHHQVIWIRLKNRQVDMIWTRLLCDILN